MPNLCCVIGCRNHGHHFFPKDAELRHQWEIAVGRKNFKAKKHSKLCFDHFRDEDYIKEGFFSGMKLKRKILKKGVIPSRFVWNEKEINKDEKQKYEMRAQRQEKVIICDMPEDEDSKENVIKCDPLQLINIEIPEDTINLINTRCDTNNDVDMNDVATKVIDATTLTSLDSPGLLSRSTCHVGTQKNYQFFCIGTIMKNNKAMNFYTGFDTYEKFQLVLSTLYPEVHLLRFKWSEVLLLSLEDQLLLTLIKLRRDRLDFELAMLFEISPATVSNIFISWVSFMHHKWSALVAKPRRVLIETCITEESTSPTSGTVAENASESSCGAIFNNQHIFAVKGVRHLKDTTKTFHFLKRRKHKKYINLMTKVLGISSVLSCNKSLFFYSRYLIYGHISIPYSSQHRPESYHR